MDYACFGIFECTRNANCIDELKMILPSDAKFIVRWFEDNYIHGHVQKTIRHGVVLRNLPLL